MCWVNMWYVERHGEGDTWLGENKLFLSGVVSDGTFQFHSAESCTL